MNGAEPDRWSDVAADWSRLWGDHPRAAWQAIATAARIDADVHVLDVGCGSGEFLRFAASLGARVSGVDPAVGMLELARRAAPDADLSAAGWESLPFDDGSIDVVVAINALQFADDLDAALAEVERVLRPGGRIAIANWAEAERNDIERIEQALAEADGEEPLPDDDLRLPGGLDRLLGSAWPILGSGIVEAVWTPADDADLLLGVLLGEDEAGLVERGPTVLAAAARFRRPDGSYRVVDAFRWVVAGGQ
ncbi:class I SAM-dependent methyltransferase [Naasia lichenicola]|uniref:Class I SAM-dependent methyltransferase n=1 Tax=Naasia lichenicola TaxID=2565933 RepID=A0A4V3WTE9_9MICO|nr:class I SAM-dependent methyltransferase [Naasia lichenicola]THG31697.1 class I SAM-dependent methyltransferase [Naasia lichenicola]